MSKSGMRPKRVGTHVCRWVMIMGKELYTADYHPIYEYMGYFILRAASVNGKDYYYEIYTKLENGEPSGFDFYLNPEKKAFRRLMDATGAIDSYLFETGVLL